MDKKSALKVLLQHSSFLNEKSKLQILEKLDRFSDEEIDTLGRFLALEKKKSLQNAVKIKHAVAMVK